MIESDEFLLAWLERDYEYVVIGLEEFAEGVGSGRLSDDVNDTDNMALIDNFKVDKIIAWHRYPVDAWVFF